MQISDEVRPGTPGSANGQTVSAAMPAAPPAVPRRKTRAPSPWRRLMNVLRHEPVQVQGLIQAAMALIITMGLPLPDSAKGEILAFTAAFLALVAKQHVTPVARPRDRHGKKLR